jgi:hypothetical protein
MMAGEVRVHLSELGADAERQSDLARLLREELLLLDVEDVRPLTTGSAPPGARGLDVAGVGSLLIALGQSANGLRAVVATVSSWLSRGDASRSVRLELDGDVLEISRASKADEARLVDLFVQRHTAEAGGAWTASERP